MSLWADYVNECGILEIIEHPWGFITFHLDVSTNPPFLGINDMYVAPEFRKEGLGTQLLAEAIAWGRGFGCDRVRALLHKNSAGFPVAEAGAIRHNFHKVAEEGPFIAIERSLEDV